MKKTIRTPTNSFSPLVLYFKWTKEAAVHNSKILAVFNGYLGEDLKSQQGIPLYYGSEFWDPAGIANLFHHHEDRDKIMNIIQRGSQ